MTLFYAAPSEADEVPMIQIRANVSEDGWDTVALVEAIWPSAQANAWLIAAAPELLEALEELLECQKFGANALARQVQRKGMALEKARAVIARAKGGTP
jgi:hypothetical protein